MPARGTIVGANLELPGVVPCRGSARRRRGRTMVRWIAVCSTCFGATWFSDSTAGWSAERTSWSKRGQCRVAFAGGCSSSDASGAQRTVARRARFRADSTLLQTAEPERIALASYPRSGNTLLRRLLEELTGILTGSDTIAGRAMAEQLREYGLAGESVSDFRTWVVKTHYPERLGCKFSAQRVILLVRHPINAIDSYFNMQLSASHTRSIKEAEYFRLADIWRNHVVEEARVWSLFHDYWLGTGLPTLLVRYEDLLVDREQQLQRLYNFLYIGDTADFEARMRLAAVFEKGDEAGLVYKPRRAALQPDFSHYAEDQQDHVLRILRCQLERFGYMDAAGRSVLLPCHSPVEAGGAVLRGSLLVNGGPPVRPSTPEDPDARGFRWKWEARKRVQLEDDSAHPGARGK